jgi:hypothetical protein
MAGPAPAGKLWGKSDELTLSLILSRLIFPSRLIKYDALKLDSSASQARQTYPVRLHRAVSTQSFWLYKFCHEVPCILEQSGTSFSSGQYDGVPKVADPPS